MTDRARELAHTIIGSECQFGRHDAICDRVTEGLQLVRKMALEEAAKVAKQWADTQPVSGALAPVIAGSMAHAGEQIDAAIRKLIED